MNPIVYRLLFGSGRGVAGRVALRLANEVFQSIMSGPMSKPSIYTGASMGSGHGLNLRIEVHDAGVQAAFDQLLAAGQNPQPALREIGEALRTSTYLRMRAGGPAPDGTPWAPLSPITLALRRQGRGTGSAKPLWSTGMLANSIHASVQGNSVTVGTNLAYAAMQQLGARQGAFGKTKRNSPIPWGNVPGRLYLGLSSDDRDNIVGILRARILGG